MNDEITDGGLAPSTAGDEPVVETALVEQLLRRVQALEVGQRRWKQLTLVALVAPTLVFLGFEGLACLGGWSVHRRYVTTMQQQATEVQRTQEERSRQLQALSSEVDDVQAEVERTRAEAQGISLNAQAAAAWVAIERERLEALRLQDLP